IPPDLVGEDRTKDLPQPAEELALGAAPEPRGAAMHLQRGLLEQVLQVYLPLEPAADLEAHQERQVVAIPLQQLSQGGAAARLDQEQQPLGIVVAVAAHPMGPLPYRRDPFIEAGTTW